MNEYQQLKLLNSLDKPSIAKALYLINIGHTIYKERLKK